MLSVSDSFVVKLYLDLLIMSFDTWKLSLAAKTSRVQHVLDLYFRMRQWCERSFRSLSFIYLFKCFPSHSFLPVGLLPLTALGQPIKPPVFSHSQDVHCSSGSSCDFACDSWSSILECPQNSPVGYHWSCIKNLLTLETSPVLALRKGISSDTNFASLWTKLDFSLCECKSWLFCVFGALWAADSDVSQVL